MISRLLFMAGAALGQISGFNFGGGALAMGAAPARRIAATPLARDQSHEMMNNATPTAASQAGPWDCGI